MRRYFIQLSFRGTHFHGWQVQNNAKTVQDELQQVLSTILRKRIEITGAGRTDTGVHAKEMFAHFDNEEELTDLQHFTFKLNSILPADIAVQKVFEVPIDYHARFTASARSYEYHLHQQKDPFKQDTSYYFNRNLSVNAMNQAAQILLEYTDFSAFSKSNTQTFTNDCTIYNAVWEITDDGLVFHISANRFLRNMVRAIVGTLLEIGIGKYEVADMHTIIQSKNRSKAGTSVPACGLYLTRVEYPFPSIN
jgi:tRNA pseudouridine38-40 synthase